MILIMNKQYSSEGLIDLSENIFDAINNVEVPKDQHGFAKGTYTIRVEFNADGEKNKPKIDIKDATDCGGFLMGTVFNHPVLGSYQDGKFIRTSYIVKRDGNTVETRNSIYNVLNWASGVTTEKKVITNEPEAAA